jgi:hypothetical protein
MHLFLETTLDLATSANRFLDAVLQPVVFRNLFVEPAASRVASKNRGICKGG